MGMEKPEREFTIIGETASPIAILVTIPVHNEVRLLREAVNSLRTDLGRALPSFQLAIAEDGSSDGSKELLRHLCAGDSSLIVQMGESKCGRGLALRNLWSKLDASFYVFCDADLPCGSSAIINAVRLAEAGHPIVTASRYVQGSRVQRPVLRRAVSVAYNGLIRALFHDGIHDHQCGLKVFNKHTLERLLPHTTEDSWFWDTEILVIARKLGYPVYEMPVEWVEKRSRRTPIRRLVSDVYLHGSGLARLKLTLPSRVPPVNSRHPATREISSEHPVSR